MQRLRYRINTRLQVYIPLLTRCPRRSLLQNKIQMRQKQIPRGLLQAKVLLPLVRAFFARHFAEPGGETQSEESQREG